MNVPLVTKFTSVHYLLWSPECARSVFLCRHFLCCLYYYSEWDRCIMCIVVLWWTERLLYVCCPTALNRRLLYVDCTTALNRTVALFLFMNVINSILLLCTAAVYLTNSSTDANSRYIWLCHRNCSMMKELLYAAGSLYNLKSLSVWILIFTNFWLFLRLWSFSNCLLRVCSVSHRVA
jgi:hypothetical protein